MKEKQACGTEGTGHRVQYTGCDTRLPSLSVLNGLKRIAEDESCLSEAQNTLTQKQGSLETLYPLVLRTEKGLVWATPGVLFPGGSLRIGGGERGAFL